MTTASPNSGRVRKIAILVSSVDKAAARQLLLHLPTELAKQVRSLAANLGPVSTQERGAILAEFQKSASEPARPAAPGNNQPSQPATQQYPGVSPSGSGNDRAYSAGHSQITPVGYESRNASHGQRDDQPNERTTDASASSAADLNTPAWTRLSTEALIRFVQGERVTVTAVVISQLTPAKAVEVLRQLPREHHRAVLQSLSQLQDIDADTTAAIDEHLAERLSDYQHRIENEHESSRRLNALLAAAPSDLQQEWQLLLAEDSSASKQTQSKPDKAESRSTPKPSVNATIAELYGDVIITSADSLPRSAATSYVAKSTFFAQESTPKESEAAAEYVSDNDADEEHILSFPDRSQEAPIVDRVFLQREFSRLLTLRPRELANLLSEIDTQTVLLALAGSTPEFMQRFASLMHPADAKTLTRQLQRIGPTRLREVDEAQRRIIANAVQFFGETRVNTKVAA